MISRQVVWVKGVVILLAGFTGLSVYLHQPPRVVSEKASPSVFSAARAMKIVQAIAQKPHPAGSEANDAVRQEIMREIRQCGINPELQETMVCRAPGTAATVRNILARVPGTANTKAVALVAHYDSVLSGPGAADDGSGVAALIETLRAVKAGPPLRNDILFIFTDGEEGVQPGKGLRGAYAFVQQHPWAQGIGLALNFDARGTAGPSYLYRTSPSNGWLIRQVIAAGCPIIANSCMGAISDRMPTDSDLTAFLEADIPGLDFAFTSNLMRYHTSLDSPGNLDPRSLQHHGEYALRLARHFGNLPLDNPEAPPAVFFNTLGTGLAIYPVSWVWPMNLAALFGLAALMGLGIKRGTLGGSDLVRGTAFFIGFAIVVVAGTLAVIAVGYVQRGYYLIYSGDRLALALIALTIWAFFTALRQFRTLVSLPGLSAGVLIIYASLLTATAIGFPGASFIFFWPLVSGAAGFALLVYRKDTVHEPSWWTCTALGLAALPSVAIMAPILYDIHLAATVLFVPVVIALLALILGMTAAPVYWLVSANRRLFPITALTFGLALLLATVFWPGFNPSQPQFTSLSYALDMDANQAYWLSCDEKTDEWTSAMIPKNTRPEPFPELLGGDRQKVLKAPAPAADLAPASIEVLENTPVEHGRRLKLWVTSPRHAPRVVLLAEPGARIRSAAVDEKPLMPVEGPWYLNYDIFLPRGIKLTLEIEDADILRLTVIEHSPELPELEQPSRPSHLIVKPNTPDFNKGWLKSNVTLVKKTFAL